MEFIEIASAAEIPPGTAKAFDIRGRAVAIYHTAKGFFATDARCPHRGGPLAEGDVIGDEIVCPWHLWGFNLSSGICDGNREISVATHEVRIEDDQILVRVDATARTASSVS